MSKYVVELNEEDLQMLKDCHSKNPSIMKSLNEAKKEDQLKKKAPIGAFFFKSFRRNIFLLDKKQVNLKLQIPRIK